MVKGSGHDDHPGPIGPHALTNLLCAITDKVEVHGEGTKICDAGNAKGSCGGWVGLHFL